MEKYTEQLDKQLREIYKSILKRIVKTGKTEESDMLFIHLYLTEVLNQPFDEQTK